ncbi:Na+/H+ antiporter subunit A [Streptomyces sp. DSM 42041]|uniref:Na+/H+ antiporter subunit A n=1 Tax=Streptomyces hazeniae TaxID=3075538 RepID=A0ABU2NMR9_9ACTN|nr:Na+/H+ antiporter subunit A [Streptomyces sp. DSM 42041]MDT0378279.1 Na+/H+ antiporter subunit A [Streptomyces sp. DSM 42041]
MWFLLAAHAGVAAALPWAARHAGRAVWLLAALVPLATVTWGAVQADRVLANEPVVARLDWAPSLGLVLDLRLDALALTMLWVVGGVGTAVLVFARTYVERDAGREAGLLLAFAGAMTGLVLADNLLVLYVFWELTTVVSFLLIAGRGEGAERRAAAERALLVTVAGGLAMLLGLVMLGEAAGSYRISEVLADPPRGGTVGAAVVLVLVGAFAKSAQMPLHGWLPAAMVAPTPVSAYLHAAAMVKAGVYLVARLAPGFAEVPVWRPLVLCVGLLSLVLGAVLALRETDLKRLLAYGTVSMLGMLTALFGAGTRTAALAGVVLLLAHAAYKSALFLTVGILDRQAGTRDLRELSGVGRRWPLFASVGALAAASLAGLPPLVGFLGKETALEAFLHGYGLPARQGLLVGLTLGAAFTVAYGARLVRGAFGGRPGDSAAQVSPPPAALLAPTAALAAAGAVLGVWYTGTADLATAYARAFPPGPEGAYKISLWHGFTPVLGLSALTLAAGVLVFLLRDAVARGAVRALGRRFRPPGPSLGYRAVVQALGVVAVGVTRRTQAGSLPAYLTVLLATVLLVPGGALLLAVPELDDVPLWWSLMEVPPALVVVAAAVAVVGITHRLTGVLLVGAVGYGVAGLFLVHGAPDLALTQFLVETMTLVVVVLVLRRMPARFTPGHTARRVRTLRGAVSVGVGVLVAFFALAATSGPRVRPASEELLLRLKETGAYNAVNAVVVEFRALDTLGEISVLLVTAIGVVSLVQVRGRSGEVLPSRPSAVSGPARRAGDRRAAGARAHWDEPRGRWLPGAHERPGFERSVLLEVVTRLLFLSIVVFSLFLLFSGHYRPGGGFAGGLVAGQALVLRYLVGGRADLGLTLPVRPGAVAGGGLAVAAVTALLPMAAGAPMLTSTLVTAHLPLLGDLKFATSLFFDVGVYLVVVGVTLKLLSAVGTSLEDRTA